MTPSVNPETFRAMPVPEAARAPAEIALARAAAARAELAAHAQTVAGMAAVAAADAASAKPTPLDMYLDTRAAIPSRAGRSAAAATSSGYATTASAPGAGYAADRPLRDEHGEPIEWTRGPAIMTENDCKAILAKSLEEAVNSIRLAQNRRFKYGWAGNTLAAVLGAATCAGVSLAARHYGYDLPEHAARWVGMAP